MSTHLEGFLSFYSIFATNFLTKLSTSSEIKVNLRKYVMILFYASLFIT